ncbi:MAG: CotH kinase family protein [Eubacteriales bacterium]|nr:CotH kinase family protein [Eubacteriales bacterium]
MSTHKYIDKICCAVLAAVLLITAALVYASSLGTQTASKNMLYGSRLFDTSKVHTIDILMDDWEGFLDTCENEEYTACSLVIDNEPYKNIGLRAKGNTSLSTVSAYGNDRYSFKIEFDHYDSSKSYYGLDKISLNNLIQDNTCMKDYLAYQMMGAFGVSAPLCSYAYITVNGEDWGLYLAVEGVEESFLERNYGKDYGELYKPDSMDMGAGPGNGGEFRMEDFQGDFEFEQGFEPFGRNEEAGDAPSGETSQSGEPPFGEGFESSEAFPDRNMEGGGMGKMDGMGSNDVRLIYSDDEYSSYSNIFDNAKTDVNDSDKDRLIASLKALGEGENLEDCVDIDAVIRYFVVHNFVCNFDSYTGSMIHNYYLYEKDGQLSMIPWDYNLAFGGFEASASAESLVNYPIDSPVSGDSVDSRPMLAWIFADEEYTELYHKAFQEFLSQYFDSGYVESLIESTAELIRPYIEKDPTSFCTCEEFDTGVAALKQFCILRAESIQGQLDGSIPSTSEGQAEDSSSLVSASGLTISDMGSMGQGKGGMGGGFMEGQAMTPNGRAMRGGFMEEQATVQDGRATESSSAKDQSITQSAKAMPDNVAEDGADGEQEDSKAESQEK